MTVPGVNFGKAASDYGTFRAATGKFDADHRELLARQFPGNMLAVPHRVFAIIAETKGTP